MATSATTTTKTTTATTRATKPELIVELLHEDLQLPTKGTEKASCYDVYLPNNVVIPPVSLCTSVVIPLGFKLDIPEGYEVFLHLRSSVGRDNTIMLSNIKGIVDEDYTGEVQAFVRNVGKQEIRFAKGQRLFQMEMRKKEIYCIKAGTVDKKTTRTGKSGSTGK